MSNYRKHIDYFFGYPLPNILKTYLIMQINVICIRVMKKMHMFGCLNLAEEQVLCLTQSFLRVTLTKFNQVLTCCLILFTLHFKIRFHQLDTFLIYSIFKYNVSYISFSIKLNEEVKLMQYIYL